MFGLGKAPTQILPRLFNPFNLKILDVYLETGLWSLLICVKKALYGGMNIWDYGKTYTFDSFVYFYLFLFFTISSILLFLVVISHYYQYFNYHYYLLLSFISLITLLTVQFIFQSLFHRNYCLYHCCYYYFYRQLLSLLSLLLIDYRY